MVNKDKTLGEKIDEIHIKVIHIDKCLAVKNEKIKSLSVWVTFHTGLFATLIAAQLLPMVLAAH